MTCVTCRRPARRLYGVRTIIGTAATARTVWECEAGHVWDEEWSVADTRAYTGTAQDPPPPSDWLAGTLDDG